MSENDQLTITIRGQEFPVRVEVYRDGTSARFVAEYEGRDIGGTTWEDMRTALMRATKKAAVKVSIPVQEYTTIHGVWRWRSGHATGKHASTGKILVTWESGTGPNWRTNSDQVSSHGGTYFQGLGAEQKAEYAALTDAKREADRAVREFEREHTISLNGVVTEAMEAELQRLVEAEK